MKSILEKMPTKQLKENLEILKQYLFASDDKLYKQHINRIYVIFDIADTYKILNERRKKG